MAQLTEANKLVIRVVGGIEVVRELDDGRALGLLPMLYSTALVLLPVDVLDRLSDWDCGYVRRFCYEHAADARAAAAAWDGADDPGPK